MPRPPIHTAPFTCPHPDTFEKFINEKFLKKRPKSEAARELMAFWRETSLENAVLLAIESVPTAKSKVLRNLLNEYMPWCQEQLAWAIWHAASPYVQSFVGERFDIVALHVTLRDAIIGSPILVHDSLTNPPRRGAHAFRRGAPDSSLSMCAHGNYVRDDGNLDMGFAFSIIIDPHLAVKVGVGHGAPKEMVSGLKKALER
jgi:hypothetical protein